MGVNLGGFQAAMPQEPGYIFQAHATVEQMGGYAVAHFPKYKRAKTFYSIGFY